MTLGIGDAAPAFTLYDNNRDEVSLDSFKGQKTLIMFFPFAFSGTCTGEICELRDNHERFAGAGARIVAITCDSVVANAAWATANSFDYPVLSDFWPHGQVSKDFGVFNEKVGCANRVSFLLDVDGTVTDVFSSASMGEARDFEAQVGALTSA